MEEQEQMVRQIYDYMGSWPDGRMARLRHDPPLGTIFVCPSDYMEHRLWTDPPTWMASDGDHVPYFLPSYPAIKA